MLNLTVTEGIMLLFLPFLAVTGADLAAEICRPSAQVQKQSRLIPMLLWLIPMTVLALAAGLGGLRLLMLLVREPVDDLFWSYRWTVSPQRYYPPAVALLCASALLAVLAKRRLCGKIAPQKSYRVAATALMLVYHVAEMLGFCILGLRVL